MHRKRLIIASLVAGMCAMAPLSWAQIYKWTDENGIVHYSSEKPRNRAVEAFRFPCYASDPTCSARVNWDTVPLNRGAFPDIIREVSAVHGVDESLIRAIIHAESAYQPDAKSPKGAQGLMQLMPKTAERFGVTDRFDPAQSLEGGATYLRFLIDHFDNDLMLAIAGYNAGENAVEKYGRTVPPYRETKGYVVKVLKFFRRNLATMRGRGAVTALNAD